jgi:hypothetical protein
MRNASATEFLRFFSKLSRITNLLPEVIVEINQQEITPESEMEFRTVDQCSAQIDFLG